MNKKIESYFNEVESQIIQNFVIQTYDIVRKEISDVDGKIRIKLALINNDRLDLFEYIVVVNEQIITKKYHFHWQDKNNKLKFRWDNAPHHKELENFPHHIHYNDKIESFGEIPNINYVLIKIKEELDN